MKRDMVDVEEAARLLGRTAWTVYQLRHRGLLRASRRGRGRNRCLHFRREDIDQVLSTWNIRTSEQERRAADAAARRLRRAQRTAAQELTRVAVTTAAYVHPLAEQLAEQLAGLPELERAAIAVEALRLARERSAAAAQELQ